MAAAWRFGLRPHVVILGQTPVGELLPVAGQSAVGGTVSGVRDRSVGISSGARDSDGITPHVICVGNVDRLWEPHIAEQLETLVGYAYAGLIPLFAELVSRQASELKGDSPSGSVVRPSPGASPVKSGFGSNRRSLTQRVAQLKAKSPLAWLDPSVLSKWPQVTDGLEPLLNAVKVERAAQQPRRARPVRLPWDPQVPKQQK
jgi:hypothetical protein